MANQERESQINVENTVLIQVDPAELIKDNPAALIVNKESYQRMDAHFSPDQLDPPQVVRVRTYSAEQGETVKRFVVDGHTRTKYADDHRDVVLPNNPDFRFVPLNVRDVTKSLVRNPFVVTEDERVPIQDGLTMLQYLRAVVPPTIEHAAIAKDRIAGHLINGWKSIVGEDLASKFSALAALNLLASRGPLAPSEQMLKQFLSQQEALVAGETVEDRQRLEGALQDTASIIRQSKLLQKDVVTSAFTLVGTGAPVIGGEREAAIQVQGLLHTTAVEDKLAQAFPNVGEREQARLELGKLIADNLSRIAEAPSRERVMSMLGQVLRDKYLSYDQVTLVFSTEEPIETYQGIRREINITNIQSDYAESLKKDALTNNEARILENLGGRMYVYEAEFDREIPAILRSAKRANEVLNRAEVFTNRIVDQQASLTQMGVRPETIANAITEIQESESSLLEANTPQASAIRARELQEIMAKVDRQIARESIAFQAGNIADEVYGDVLQAGFGPQVRRGIVQYILRDVDSGNEVVIKQRLNQLHGLDNDLQAKVISGEIRLQVALGMHMKRHTVIPGAPRKPHVDLPDVSPKPPKPPAIRDIPIEIIQPIESIEEQLTHATQAEQHRKEINNTRATNVANTFSSEIDSIDLDTEDVSPEAKFALDQAFNKIGQLLYKHPNAARVLGEDYPKLIDQQTKSIANQIDQEQEDLGKDTRTRR